MTKKDVVREKIEKIRADAIQEVTVSVHFSSYMVIKNQEFAGKDYRFEQIYELFDVGISRGHGVDNAVALYRWLSRHFSPKADGPHYQPSLSPRDQDTMARLIADVEATGHVPDPIIQREMQRYR